MRALRDLSMLKSIARMADLLPASKVPSVIGALPRTSWIQETEGARFCSPRTLVYSIFVVARYPQADRAANPILRVPVSSGLDVTLASSHPGLNP